jgi:hypothetical protein
MADKMPDYHVEQQKIRVQIANLQANLARYDLDIMEADSRKKQAYINIEATKEAIAHSEETLASLIEAHGAEEQ